MWTLHEVNIQILSPDMYAITADSTVEGLKETEKLHIFAMLSH